MFLDQTDNKDKTGGKTVHIQQKAHLDTFFLSCFFTFGASWEKVVAT